MRKLYLSSLFAALACALTFAAPQQDGGGIKGAKMPGKGTVKTDIFNDRAPVPPKRGGEVVQAVHVGFRSLDAEQDNSALTSEVCHQYVQEALVSSDVETWENVPMLAERWDTEDIVEKTDGTLVRGKVTEGSPGYEGGYVVKDLKGEKVAELKKGEVKDVRYQTSFTFHLRRGVVFQNGDPFTAKDVAWTIALLRSPKNGMPNIQGYFAKITECTVVDDFTVRMTYAEQYWMALTVCGGYAYMRPHKAWDPEGQLFKDPDGFFKTFNEHKLIMNPIGTGPYAVESFKKDVDVVLKRHEAWWGATGRPAPANSQYPDRIRFRIIKDPVAQLKALENGEVDFVTQTPPGDWDEFFGSDEKPKEEIRKRFARVEMVYPNFGYYGFNMRRPLWKDKNVRRAIAMASGDLDRFIKDVMRGRAERVWSALYKYAPSYATHLKPVEHNPKKAEEILGEAGWFDSDGDGVIDKDGVPLRFEMLTRSLPPTTPVMQHALLMQQSLKSIGIDMQIRSLEWTALLEKLDRGDFDVIRMGWALSSPPNTQDNFQIWHSSQIGESGSNHIAYANKRVDELLEQTRRELDPEKRKKLQIEFQEIIHDEQPYIFLYMPAELRAYNKKWRGVRFFVPRPCHSLNEWYQE